MLPYRRNITPRTYFLFYRQFHACNRFFYSNHPAKMSAPAALDTATLEKFRKITAMTYKEQAVFYLNAFWKDGAEAEAESVWKTMHDFIAVDHAKEIGRASCRERV